VEWFQQFLALPHGIPSHDTFRRVLSRLKLDELTQCFVNWTETLRESRDGAIVALDGKTLRRAFAHTASTGAIHMISAWANAHRLVLSQRKVDDKSNEMTAILTLLRMVELEGRYRHDRRHGVSKSDCQDHDRAGSRVRLGPQRQPASPA
jgi:hypothetical protein